MTLTYLTQSDTQVLDSNGNGVLSVSPGSSQFWMPTLVKVGTVSQGPPFPFTVVYLGAPNVFDATTFVDQTFMGDNDQSSMISGSVAQFGDTISAVFSGGNPGDTAFMRITGLSSDIPPGDGAIPQVPGARFIQSSNPKSVSPNQAPLLIDTGVLASGASFTILPAVTGKRYFLFDVYLNPVNALGLFKLQQGNGTGVGRFIDNALGAPTNTPVPPVSPMNFSGAALQVGASLQIVNQASGSVQYIGYVTYSE